tara:strand:- start:517 stop:768 length:252 start_codon:yes stop_codon:yes gene_type:complete
MTGKIFLIIFLVFLTYFFSYLAINVSFNFIYLLVTVIFASNFVLIIFFLTKSRDNLPLENIKPKESANEHPIIVSARERLGKD